MIEVRKSTKNPTMTAIRAASGRELSLYEKCKLERIEENAQENKLEIVSVNGQRLQIENKAVNIELGDLASKDIIKPDDISTDLYYIQCDLD